MLDQTAAPASDNGDQCEICGGLGWVRQDVPLDHPDYGQLHPCRCSLDDWRERRLKRLSQISGMLPEEMRITFDDILERASDTAEMVQAAREFVKDPYGILTLWGGVGNGKTLVLYATINALRERGHEAAYVRFKDLLDWMRDGFANNDQRRRYKFLRTIDALAIDELDKARDTQYAQEFSTAFFDDRYRLAWAGRAVTLIAMNNDPHTLPAHIRDRLYDGRFNIVHNSDKSLRPHMTR